MSISKPLQFNRIGLYDAVMLSESDIQHPSTTLLIHLTTTLEKKNDYAVVSLSTIHSLSYAEKQK